MGAPDSLRINSMLLLTGWLYEQTKVLLLASSVLYHKHRLTTAGQFNLFTSNKQTRHGGIKVPHRQKRGRTCVILYVTDLTLNQHRYHMLFLVRSL